MKQRYSPRFTKIMITIFTIFIFMFCFSNVYAQENKITAKSLFKFSAGLLAGFSIHEASHYVTAKVTGSEIDWDTGQYNQPIAFTERKVASDSDGVLLYASGLITQAVGAEIILQSENIDKNDAFVRGMMAWDILNPIFYSLDYWFIRRSNREVGKYWHQGDFEGIEHYSNERTADVFGITMVGIAALQGYRFLQTQPWTPDFLKGSVSNRLHFGVLPSGGLGLTYEIRF